MMTICVPFNVFAIRIKLNPGFSMTPEFFLYSRSFWQTSDKADKVDLIFDLISISDNDSCDTIERMVAFNTFMHIRKISILITILIKGKKQASTNWPITFESSFGQYTNPIIVFKSCMIAITLCLCVCVFPFWKWAIELTSTRCVPT